jgi:hypothetical protein
VSEEYIKGKDEENKQRRNDDTKIQGQNTTDPVLALPMFPKNQKYGKKNIRKRRSRDEKKKAKRSRTKIPSEIQIDNISRASTPPTIDPEVINVKSSNNIELQPPNEFSNIIIESTGIR